MLILAGASLNVLVGQNGILRKAQEAVNAYRKAEENEEEEFKKVEYQLAQENPDDYLKSSASISDKIEFARTYLNASVSVTTGDEILMWVPGATVVKGYKSNSSTINEYNVEVAKEADCVVKNSTLTFDGHRINRLK